ncbi:MAG TPA: hypothetical protein VFY87_16615 [Geminicoccaceae bacterium]|nr:hypothetical protein [Geminicoccaceae bacterium]
MIVAPWSWEFTSGENPAYAHTAETCYFVGGTRESLTIPHLDLWHNPTKPSWSEPIERQQLPVEAQDPLGPQVRQFCRVIRGTEKPLVLGHESLETLKPGFPVWLRPTRPKAAETLAKPLLPSFTRRVRQDSAT